MLAKLLEQLGQAKAGSKLVAAAVLVALVGLAGLAAVVARRPHFELLYSELSASESAKVQKALSDAGVPFEGSQPPGPFSVHVDRSDRVRALHAVASAGALQRAEGGILPGDGGISTVFMSAEERAQVTRKRQWQEMELLLEQLDFVAQATVTTTGGERNPFGADEPRTGSVMLQLRHRGEPLTRAQANTIANLIENGLGLDRRHLNVSDQSGNSLFDGSELDELGGANDWLEEKRTFERDLEERANDVLAAVLGPNKARVAVSSTWNHDLNTTVSETADPGARVVLSETVSSSRTPQGSAPSVGGATGVGADAGAFGVDQAAAPEQDETASTSASAAPPTAKTDDSSTRYWTPTETRRTVSLTPRLERLSVSLFLDQSLTEQAAELEQNVKAAVGFDAAREDVFSTVKLALYAPPADESEPAPEPKALSPLVETLVERGIEIVCALAFLFLLAKALKGAKRGAATEPARREPQEDVLELLAQAQIEELVKSDPERVGQILSAWAREEKVSA